ncbi:MAG: FAD-dependent oxidoreductase [Brevundimonas sp.]|uniref:FAD-dependent oxidoreductase n=1 Tax=Brevundimonas sp. TaxID=1871086 RepID=UPI0027281E51|nr:FAD-dependent oxidoreductase [Brevundimonas sp.]MDO9607272.1 FAD-dependent oxidoreductase [Brevundimonas sp.]
MSVVSIASRRAVLTGLAGTVAGCAVTPAAPVTGFAPRRIAPILMAPERIIRITVCTRPFRPTGPRLDAETVGDTKVVHNYGHGGSGWSLSWGSSAIVARKAMALAGLAGGPPVIAVIGSGALGLTSALQLQRMGARVTIYARERAAFTRSMRATGSWTPDSRIADADHVGPDFPALWEQMARETYATHQTYLGTEGDPVVFSDRYMLSGGADLSRTAEPPPIRTAPGVKPIRFAEYRLDGLAPRSIPLPASASPFPVGETRMVSAMQFNVAELAHRLEAEFLAHGGRIETRTFNTPADLTTLSEKIVVNCTGYGARALFEDKELIPVRGQIAWLAPQPEANYGLHFRGVTVLSRPDGIVVQATRNDMNGVGIDDETPDRAEANATIGLVAPLFPSIRRLPTG